MTETDCTQRPLQMPAKFLPHLEKYRVYQMMKDMVRDLIVHLPRDHLKHMKIFLSRHLYTSEASRMLLLIAPDLTMDVKALAKQMIKDFGCFVITRRCVMDRYEKHDDYVPGCVDPTLMSEVTKKLTFKEPPQAGWLMFDHPCTVREARCLQQDGVLPTVTLVLMKTPPPEPPATNNHTSARNFFQQDFEGLKYAYKATLKEVYIDPEDDADKISTKCFNAVRAANVGVQGSKQGFNVIGAPSVYRVLILGPRGSGRRTQAYTLAKHFGLDMVRDLIVHLPRDHLKHMKIFLSRHLYTSEASRMLLLIAPDLTMDVKALAKQMIKDFGCFVITRRCVMDRYEKHDDYVPGCVDPTLMSEVTKKLTFKEPVPQAGWLMFDHPCTVREARCLQQDGVLPTVTLVLMKTPPPEPPATNNHTSARNFFQQDFEGLKYAYKATLKEVYIDPEDDADKISTKCFNAVRAANVGVQGSKQGFNVIGAPSVYRVLILGPRGSGRRTQAYTLAKHFGLVFLHFDALFAEAKLKKNEMGESIRKYGTTIKLRAEAVKERILRRDCIDNGWVLTGYPTCGNDFELLDSMDTPPNRIIFLNVDLKTCRERSFAMGTDWCTGKQVPMGSNPRVIHHPNYDEELMEYEWDTYFSEALAELRAAAGITAVEIDGTEPIDKIQVKIQAAVIAAPAFDIESCSVLRNGRAD